MFGAFVLARDRHHNLRIQGSMGVAILFFFSWILASLAWSDDPALAVRRVVCFAILWFAAFGVACHYKQREVFHFLFLAALAFICLGLVTELALGTFAPADPLYRFCGTIHPNHQAWNCAGLALSGIALGEMERPRRFLFLLGSALGIGALILTKSRTSLGAFVVALVVHKTLVLTRKRKDFWIQSMLVVCAVVALLQATLPPPERAELTSITERTILLGRSTRQAETLTGRTTLWRSGLGYFYNRPLLGYGFNAFETPQRIMDLRREAGWAATAFHSEYFDLLLGVGCIGGVAYVFVILCGLRRTLALYKLHHNKYYAMECAIVVFLLVTMLLENPGRDPNVPTFVFFTILARRGLLREPELHASPTTWRYGVKAPDTTESYAQALRS